jgi:hypothetical protein
MKKRFLYSIMRKSDDKFMCAVSAECIEDALESYWEVSCGRWEVIQQKYYAVDFRPAHRYNFPINMKEAK